MPQLHLEKIHLTGFKNYEDARFTFGKSLNCIVGENGCGKTNLIDAIYWLGLTKSAFHTQDSYSIQHDTDFMMLDGWFWRDHKPVQITGSVQRGHRKVFMVNKKPYERLSEHIGEFPMVLISPNDADLVREGSEERRRLMDGIISQLDQHYLQNLLQYNKILSQRNTALKLFTERQYVDHDLLDTYDNALLPLANLIFDRRTLFITQFEPLVKHYYAYLGDNREQISITYQSEIEKLNFREIFRQYRSGDVNAQRTLMGIHRDELLFEMDGQLVRKFGSQGQQKSFVMALRLAQFELLSVEKESKPLLLLDDIFDKLDDRRIQKLLQLIENQAFGQVFLTDARPERTETLTKSLQTEVTFLRLAL